MMAGASTTLHWHGFHQKETPWMDGKLKLILLYSEHFLHDLSFRSTFHYTMSNRLFNDISLLFQGN